MGTGTIFLIVILGLVAYIIAMYNRLVRHKNLVEAFPSNIIAGQFGFVRAKFFEIEEDADRAVPQAAASVNITEVGDALQMAFQDLLDDLGVAPAGTDTPRDYLTELTAAFDAALAGLLDTATAAGALPPVSEPSGNGVAYAKFLAIYNDLQADTPPETDPGQSGTEGVTTDSTDNGADDSIDIQI